VEEAVEILEAEEAVLEGVGGGAEFAGKGTGAGGFLGISAIGGEGGLGHGFLAWGLHGRWIVGNILFFVHEPYSCSKGERLR